LRVKVQVSSAHVRYRTRTQRAQIALGSIAYNVRGGQSLTTKVKLTSAAYRLLERVVGHSWNATVTSTVTLGTVSGTQLTMTGPTPPRLKARPHKRAGKHKHHR
jgi:hypothetical protein